MNRTAMLLTLSLVWAGSFAATDDWFGEPPNHADDAIGVATIMASPEEWEGRELLTLFPFT